MIAAAVFAGTVGSEAITQKFQEGLSVGDRFRKGALENPELLFASEQDRLASLRPVFDELIGALQAPGKDTAFKQIIDKLVGLRQESITTALADDKLTTTEAGKIAFLNQQIQDVFTLRRGVIEQFPFAKFADQGRTEGLAQAVGLDAIGQEQQAILALLREAAFTPEGAQATPDFSAAQKAIVDLLKQDTTLGLQSVIRVNQVAPQPTAEGVVEVAQPNPESRSEAERVMISPLPPDPVNAPNAFDLNDLVDALTLPVPRVSMDIAVPVNVNLPVELKQALAGTPSGQAILKQIQVALDSPEFKELLRQANEETIREWLATELAGLLGPRYEAP